MSLVTQYRDLNFSFLEEQSPASALDIEETNMPKPLSTSRPAEFPTTPFTDQVPQTPPLA
ncbi:hypothetical protein PanWU01x14_093050 [Parasponia andersonii]|uniref:Uncharacterized protein n=1 Tax=Parasponia andersonii TaxID=3476 RepID=A0A2P5D654_PARAD|nr:hypothetical protein PanWU01x14_093050 [Parasponia andersonii]